MLSKGTLLKRSSREKSFLPLPFVVVRNSDCWPVTPIQHDQHKSNPKSRHTRLDRFVAFNSNHTFFPVGNPSLFTNGASHPIINLAVMHNTEHEVPVQRKEQPQESSVRSRQNEPGPASMPTSSNLNSRLKLIPTGVCRVFRGNE